MPNYILLTCASVFPKEIVKRMKKGTAQALDPLENVTVMFTDFVQFTKWASNLQPVEVVDILNKIFCKFDKILQELKVEKIKTYVSFCRSNNVYSIGYAKFGILTATVIRILLLAVFHFR